jgi:hypothetical protein
MSTPESEQQEEIDRGEDIAEPAEAGAEAQVRGDDDEPGNEAPRYPASPEGQAMRLAEEPPD